MIGWMFNREKVPNDEDDSEGALSIPRELHIVDGVIKSFPIDEAKFLLKKRSEHVNIEDGIITISYKEEVIARYDTNKINEIEKIEKVDIITDERCVEIFINDGRMNFSRMLF